MSLAVTVTIVNKSARPEFLSKEYPKPVPGYQLVPLNNNTINDWSESCQRQTEYIWGEREDGSHCLRWDSAWFHLERSLDEFNEGKAFNDKVFPHALEASDHDSLDVRHIAVGFKKAI